MGGGSDGRGTVVAIDGPAGSGKSTVSRRVARRLGLRYLDTGAMYRALTWQVLEDGIELGDRALSAAAAAIELRMSTDPDRPRVWVGGREVTAEVREPRVTALVSLVSAVPGVRASMVRRQQEIIGTGGIVVEGRDIGQVVAPQARPKVFLTASSDARASRRGAQAFEAPGELAVVKREIDRRDLADSTRIASPLVPASDATRIDSTGLTVDQVVDRVVALVSAGSNR